MPASQFALARGHDQHELLARRVLQQVGEGLGGRRVTPVGVVHHHVKRRIPGCISKRRADTIQQPVACPLGRGDLPRPHGLRDRRVSAQLGHERRELWARRSCELTAPPISTGARELADRPYPRLKGDVRLRGAARQRHDRALRVGFGGRRGGMARLSDPRLTEH